MSVLSAVLGGVVILSPVTEKVVKNVVEFVSDETFLKFFAFFVVVLLIATSVRTPSPPLSTLVEEESSPKKVQIQIDEFGNVVDENGTRVRIDKDGNVVDDPKKEKRVQIQIDERGFFVEDESSTSRKEKKEDEPLRRTRRKTRSSTRR